MSNHEPPEFDPSKVVIEAVPWSNTNKAIRYDDQYAGAVVLKENGKYSCAVSLVEEDQRILREFSTATSINGSAESVGHQYWLTNIYCKTSALKAP